MSEPFDRAAAEAAIRNFSAKAVPLRAAHEVYAVVGHLRAALAELDRERARHIPTYTADLEVTLEVIAEALGGTTGPAGITHRAAELVAERDRLAAENARMKDAEMDAANYHGKCGACGTPNAHMLTDDYCAVCDRDRLAAENARLREAIRDAGFAVMETSGKWSIYDVSEKAKADEERTAEVIAENIDLAAENARLRGRVAELEAKAKPFVSLADNLDRWPVSSYADTDRLVIERGDAPGGPTVADLRLLAAAVRGPTPPEKPPC